jgi:hypothetical protein
MATGLAFEFVFAQEALEEAAVACSSLRIAITMSWVT